MKQVIAALVGALVVASVAASGLATDAGNAARQQAVARKGATVMPFDLRRTTHFFDDTLTGGVETVTANSPEDAEQIAAVRAHLAEEAKRFARGDFSDPAKIHGDDMPGLATLTAAGGALQVTYRSVPGGASLTYSSHDNEVVAAIHRWFAAQRSDHGAHGHMHQ